MAKKVDGVIEAVRYKNGQILTVRAYERRGATFSDHILLGRRELLGRIKSGKRFVIGERKKFMASTFEQGKPVQVLNRDGKDIISTHAEASRDELERTPVF